MVAIDSQEIPEDFPLATFVNLMGEFGQIDARMYETVRQESKIAAEQRRIELEEEEKKRQIESDKIDEAKGEATPEKAEPAKDEAAKNEPAKPGQPSKADDEVTEESVQSDSNVDGGNNDAGSEGNPPAADETAKPAEATDPK
jgi:uncharacterized membrane protein